MRYKRIASLFLPFFLFHVLICFPGARAEETAGTDPLSEKAEGSHQQPAPKVEKTVSDLSVSVESVLKQWGGKREILTVDVRSHEDFGKFHIPGSIHIPLFALRTKGFLRSEPVILVNEGHSSALLKQEVGKLRASGFESVRILGGGLRLWKQKGGLAEGDSFAGEELKEISPSVFFPQKDDESLILTDVSARMNPQARGRVPKTIHVPFSDDPEPFLSRFDAAIREYRSDPLLFVVVFNDTGEGYDRVEKALEKSTDVPVFYLRGGWQGCETFVRQQDLIRQARQNPTRERVRKCGRCP